MTYHTQAFIANSIQDLSNQISAYLAAHPTFIGISVTNTVEGAAFFCILLYSV